MGSTIRHFGFVVDDINGAIAFWVDVLGWKISSDVREPSPFIDELIAIPEPRLRTVKISDENGMIIELLKFDSDDQTTERMWGGTLSTIGPTHIALTVENLDSIISSALELGYIKVSDPLLAPSGAVRVLFIQSPEGLMIELVQEIPESS
jgi:catechol 2,3-dioxygenase-like lactoylglutathione lyase family enzyme